MIDLTLNSGAQISVGRHCGFGDHLVFISLMQSVLQSQSKKIPILEMLIIFFTVPIGLTRQIISVLTWEKWVFSLPVTPMQII